MTTRKTARAASRRHRIDAETTKEVEALARIVGADESSIHGRRLLFQHPKKLPKLEGYAKCGETVDLVLRGLTWSVAGAILVNLVEVRKELKKYKDWTWK
jgi:hypothetical protein